MLTADAIRQYDLDLWLKVSVLVLVVAVTLSLFGKTIRSVFKWLWIIVSTCCFSFVVLLVLFNVEPTGSILKTVLLNSDKFKSFVFGHQEL